MLSVFPLDVLDEIWDLIESVSEGFNKHKREYGDDFKYWAEVFEHTFCIQIIMLHIIGVYPIFILLFQTNRITIILVSNICPTRRLNEAASLNRSRKEL